MHDPAVSPDDTIRPDRQADISGLRGREMVKPATSSSGFFQANPVLDKNQYESDKGLQRTLRFFRPHSLSRTLESRAVKELTELGAEVVTPQTYEWVDEAERNPPFIVEQDTFGHPINKLVTSEGWRRLKDVAAVQGVVSTAFERRYAEYSRLVSFAKVYLFGPSSAMVSCPLAMTDGCAKLLEANGLTTPGMRRAFDHLTTRTPSRAWTSGQWMTERPGGSDVSRSETTAVKTRAGHDYYCLDGFKWFSSATDSQVSVMLAHRVDRKGNHLDGGKLSCFLGYVQDEDGKTSSVRLHRLKKKFGTTPLPTAEVQLTALKGELLGKPGQGVKTIATVLNVTRVYSSVSSLAFWRRALYIAKEYSLVRSVFGKKLYQLPAHVRVLASQEIQIRGHSFLSFYGAALLGREEVVPKDLTEQEKVLLRIIPGLSKISTCKRAVRGVSECMEALGGVGYLEHDVRMNIGKLLRDCQVNAIWEGTTNVLCDDAIRYISKDWKSVKKALIWFADNHLEDDETEFHVSARSELRVIVKDRLEKWIAKFESTPFPELQRDARAVMFPLADIVISILTVADLRPTRDMIQDSIAEVVAGTWARQSTVSSFDLDYLVVYEKPLDEKPKL
ncbi:hypothetical protein AWJ20_2417 [Sugiyamaella lignohabitans]|uniref:Acyl-CoA dehydrogenase n=1 Tax=Sugiyamaella lignohabitans TaxID=796027 RepID=A0A167F441_9ASCO|nr:uncharacterized protein AWJ20_2417 [Sugiyamaella lignohabitans]ANB14806.1 hypothetical protein AWJ20_2417 [Sugiyamaella lignohabitans]